MRGQVAIATDVTACQGGQIPQRVQEVMSHCPVEKDHLAALRHFIAELRDGYATFRCGLSRARRRELIRQVFACHRQNRDSAGVGRDAGSSWSVFCSRDAADGRAPYRREIPPSTAIRAPLTYAAARDAR